MKAKSTANSVLIPAIGFAPRLLLEWLAAYSDIVSLISVEQPSVSYPKNPYFIVKLKAKGDLAAWHKNLTDYINDNI